MGLRLLAHTIVTVAAALVLSAMPVTVAACEGLVDGVGGIVASVTDGDTVVLDSGVVIRLIGTQAPKLPLGRQGFEPWPKAEEAKAALEAMALGKTVRLRYGGERVDRHGRMLGQLFVSGEPELWVQGRMIADGWARVYSFPDNRACLTQLLAAETQARLMKLGIWADPYYLVRRADRPADVAGRPGQYELVEGRVLLADEAQGRIYLNFGRSWKDDFTAVIDRAALKLFSASGLDPLRLEGALVRIRGWVDDLDGPRIEITHPEQIEVLRAP
jgi:endonuclease YncB( thermonuclease family)